MTKRHQGWLLISGLGICATVSTNRMGKSRSLEQRRQGRLSHFRCDQVEVSGEASSRQCEVRKEVGTDYINGACFIETDMEHGCGM